MQRVELEYQGVDSPQGKFWAIEVAPDNQGLIIEYGACGSKPRTSHVPRSRYADSSSSHEAEIRRRVDDKTDKGYMVVRRLSKPTPAGVSQPASKSDCVAYVAFDQKPLAVDGVKETLERFARNVYFKDSWVVEEQTVRWHVSGTLPGVIHLTEVSIAGPGFELKAEDKYLALASAYLADRFSDWVHLSNPDGDPVAVEWLVRAFEFGAEELAQIRPPLVTTAGPLGAWFF